MRVLSLLLLAGCGSISNMDTHGACFDFADAMSAKAAQCVSADRSDLIRSECSGMLPGKAGQIDHCTELLIAASCPAFLATTLDQFCPVIRKAPKL